MTSRIFRFIVDVLSNDKCHLYRVFAHDVTAAMLVFQFKIILIRCIPIFVHKSDFCLLNYTSNCFKEAGLSSVQVWILLALYLSLCYFHFEKWWSRYVLGNGLYLATQSIIYLWCRFDIFGKAFIQQFVKYKEKPNCEDIFLVIDWPTVLTLAGCRVPSFND